MKVATNDATGEVVISEKPDAGWTLREVDEIPQGRGALRWDGSRLIREMTPGEIAAIKEEAGRLILAKMPDYAQRNALARMLALVLSLIQRNAPQWLEKLTTEEADDLARVLAVWEQIEAVRDHSDELERDPAAGPWPEISATAPRKATP